MPACLGMPELDYGGILTSIMTPHVRDRHRCTRHDPVVDKMPENLGVEALYLELQPSGFWLRRMSRIRWGARPSLCPT